MSFISNAYANTGAAPQGDMIQMVIMLVVFGLIFYFMIYRPQAKRVKEHKNLMSSLSKGDEILTTGGVMGKIVKLPEGSDYLLIALNDTTHITIKRDYIAAVLPKGSLQSL